MKYLKNTAAFAAVYDGRAYEYGRKEAGSGGGEEADLSAIRKSLAEVTDKVKAFAEEAKGKFEKGEQLSAGVKEQVDEALSGMNEMKERLTELEQKAARRGRDEQGDEGGKTLGELLIESEAFKNGGMDSSARKSLRVKMSRKDITNANGTVGTGRSPGTSLNPSDRRPGIVAPPMRTMTIRSLLMPGETSQGSVEYTQETGFTNNAAAVAETAAKPKSDITFDLKNAPVRTIAHYFKASRQILDDAPGLRSYIDGRAEYGLLLKEEQQFLSGDGTGANILGILPQATPFAVPAGMPPVTGVTAIDRLRIAILQVVLAEYPSSGFVLNPIDWATIELTKDSQNRYILGNPQEGATPRLWRLPVVETPAIAQNTFLTGAFNMAAQIFDRMEIEVLLSTENEDDFIKNMVTIRAEERLALAVYRPEAFVTGEITPE
ncbi:phage major capsid protein [Shinella sp. BYT-45]|uniref:phage major capsid protein n=1 Tax=Shinella sp. BYT-45 TaxID=3377377 RepID=UPI00397F5B13